MISITKRLQFAALAGSIVVFLAAWPLRVLRGGAVPARTLSPHGHLMTPATIIDGSIHPETIQDQDAFRLFFLVAATNANPMPEEKARQRAILSPALLSEEELVIATAVLMDFRAQYDSAVQEYNDAVASAGAPGQLPDGRKLVADLDALALATKAKLDSSISVASSLRLYKHVQGEKLKMRVTAQ